MLELLVLVERPFRPVYSLPVGLRTETAVEMPLHLLRTPSMSLPLVSLRQGERVPKMVVLGLDEGL